MAAAPPLAGAAASAPPPPVPKVQLPDDGPPVPGATRRVFDGYRFAEDDQIGEGTYGKVFRGTDAARGDKVALKMIRTDNEKEGFPITAIREIKILSNLKHENIVNLREIVRGDVDAASGYKGAIYMVFDYAEHDLTGMIDSYKNKLTVGQVKCIMLQLLRGLSYCHINGVLHRDLKAANILITRDGILKLADFGLARTYLDEGTQKMTNRVITLWYRPPELLLGAEHYDPKIDIWSVGCIFAELLSGKPLFPGKDEADTLRRILEFMGLPTNKTWPGIEEWPFYKDINRATLRPDNSSHFQRWCKDHLMDQEAIPLLQRMLTLDPRKRISASEALMDPYLWEVDPRPCRPTDLPKLPDAHEFTTKKSRDKRHHAQQQQQYAQQQQQQQQHAGGGGRPYAGAAAGYGGGGGGGHAPQPGAYDGRNVRQRTGPPPQGYPMA
ncbi:MAG: cyclin dependent kinase, partial [Monoraphidium minutum]